MKPREWWGNIVTGKLCLPDPNGPQPNTVFLVEKSAYDALAAENEKMKHILATSVVLPGRPSDELIKLRAARVPSSWRDDETKATCYRCCTCEKALAKHGGEK